MSAIAVNPADLSPHPSHHPDELPAHDFQNVPPAPPIDRDQLFDRFVGNIDFALTLLNEFAKTSQSELETFDAALSEQNRAAICSKAHGLKGVVSILSANKLMEICSNLESTTSHTDWEQTRNLIQQLHHEMRRTIDDIPNIRALS